MRMSMKYKVEAFVFVLVALSFVLDKASSLLEGFLDRREKNVKAEH